MKNTIKIVVLIILELSFFSLKAANDSERLVPGCQLLAGQESEAETSASNGTSNDLLTLVHVAQGKNALLDSVYVDIFLDYQLEKRKWVLKYDGVRLKSRELQYFSDTYAIQFGQSDQWIYNENDQLETYQELNRVFDDYDSLFLLDYTYYTYENSLLIKRTAWNGRGIHGGIRITQEGDTIYEVEVTFNEVNYFYQYNEKGLMEKMYWKTKRDWEPDSVYNENSYFYASDDRQEYIVMFSEEFGYSVRKFIYEVTDTSKLVHEKLLVNNNIFSIDKDTIKTWTGAWDYLTIYDRSGRDSIYLSEGLDGKQNPDYWKEKVAYFYNADGSFSGAILSYWNGTIEDGEWSDKIRTDYTYDTDGKLIHYQKNYYDNQYNIWRAQETHEYFYSPIITTENREAQLSDELILYPNPASDQLYVKLDTKSPVMYIVYDLYGRQVLTGKLAGQSIDVTELVKGTYLLKITNSDGNFIKRLVKM